MAGQGARIHKMDRQHATSTSFPPGTWGDWILTLHINQIAGYTDPLLFLLNEPAPNAVDNQGQSPSSSVYCRSKVLSDSLVRVLILQAPPNLYPFV